MPLAKLLSLHIFFFLLKDRSFSSAFTPCGGCEAGTAFPLTLKREPVLRPRRGVPSGLPSLLPSRGACCSPASGACALVSPSLRPLLGGLPILFSSHEGQSQDVFRILSAVKPFTQAVSLLSQNRGQACQFFSCRSLSYYFHYPFQRVRLLILERGSRGGR